MPSSKPETSADRTPIFPYEVPWPGYGNSKVTLADIAGNAEEYRNYNSIIGTFDPDAPTVTIEQIKKFASPLDMTEVCQNDFVTNVWLISCFYIAPVHWKSLEQDRRSVSGLLAEITEAAEKLNGLLGRLPPKIDAVMLFMRRVEPDALNPDGQLFSNTTYELHDLAIVAQKVADEIALKGGRPAQFVRDTAIELLLTELQKAGVYNLSISDGNKNQGPHLAGKSGEFLATLLQHLAPDQADESWIPKIKAVRAKVNRSSAADTKSQNTS